MTSFAPPPTYAEPVTVNEVTRKAQFSPVWLKWFLEVAQYISANGGTATTIQHNSLAGLQGGDSTAKEYYHLNQTAYSLITTMGTPTAGGVAYGDGTEVKFTAAGTTGQVLSSNGAAAPTWTTPAGGTVTSVGLAMPSQFAIPNSPVTGSGTLTAAWNTQTANYVLAGPTSGSAAAPTFRALTAGDIPALSYAPPTSGTSILYGNGTGGFSNVTIGSGITFSAGTLSATGSGGNVVGPASATDNAVARFDTTTGKLIQNSGVIINDANDMSGVESLTLSGSVPAVTTTPGMLWFDSSTDTLNLQQNNITQQIGEELFVYGKASAAINDSPLQIIRKTGTVGASGVISFGPTIAGITDPGVIIGVATEPIASNSFGRVTSFGIVHGITTNGSAFGETWHDNDDIWYNPTTGNPTNVKPVAPGIKTKVGTVINAGPGGSGSFQVLLEPSTILGGTDANVQFGTINPNDLIQYNSSLGYWTNVAPTTVLAGATGAPVTKTADFTVGTSDYWIINNKSGSTCTATLPTASTSTGRVLRFQNYQAQTLVSASSNVVPLVGGSATTAILSAVAGDTCTLVSDGTNWVMTQYTPNNVLLLE